MNTLTRSLLGMALAAGAVYLFDPVSGHRRRLILRDRCATAAKRLDYRTRGVREGLSHRAHGIAERAHGRFERARVSDKALTSRVRKVLGHSASHPAAIAAAVHDGHVILRGDVFTYEHERLLDEIRRIHGVSIVTDHLTTRERAEGMPRPGGAHNGGPIAARLLLGATGCALLIWGVRERKALGSFGATVGQTLWRVSRREIDEALTRAEKAAGEGRPAVDEPAIGEPPIGHAPNRTHPQRGNGGAGNGGAGNGDAAAGARSSNVA